MQGVKGLGSQLGRNTNYLRKRSKAGALLFFRAQDYRSRTNLLPGISKYDGGGDIWLVPGLSVPVGDSVPPFEMMAWFRTSVVGSGLTRMLTDSSRLGAVGSIIVLRMVKMSAENLPKQPLPLPLMVKSSKFE